MVRIQVLQAHYAAMVNRTGRCADDAHLLQGFPGRLSALMPQEAHDEVRADPCMLLCLLLKGCYQVASVAEEQQHLWHRGNTF